MSDRDAVRRLAIVQALTEIGSPGAMQTLEKALDDADRDVRIVAARAITARAHRPALARFDAIIKGKAVRDADRTEKMVFFEGFGSFCGDAGVPHLDAILNGKSFLGRREDPEIRACAAMALGRIGSPAATEALRKSAGEKDVIVRNAVARALRGGGSTGAGE
jgi:HEAT repeat protein